MAAIRLILTVAASLAILLGAIWISQGAGASPVSASPFATSQTPWIYRGAMMASIGLIVLWRMHRLAR